MIAAPPSQHVSAGALALLVHGLLLLGLIFGLSWTSLPLRPIQADLWTALPEQPPPPPPPAAMEPASPPDPAPARKVEPAAKPAPSPAEIALEQEKRRAREQRLREERERKAALEETLKRQAEETRARVEAAREERAREEQRTRLERERADAELRDQRQRQIAEEIARMRDEMEAAAARERDLLAREREVQARERDAQARVHDARQARVVEDFKLRIKEKILAYLRLPPNLKGNPEVEYRVDLLPNGEVLRVTLRRSSGQPAYDAEVERAILRSSPLPLPPDRDTARVFREGLILKFRPSENAGG